MIPKSLTAWILLQVYVLISRIRTNRCYTIMDSTAMYAGAEGKDRVYANQTL